MEKKIFSRDNTKAVVPARGARGRLPPMLKKMALVIFPNSIRKLGVGIHLRCEKIINTKYL